MGVLGIGEIILAVVVYMGIHYWRLNRHTPITYWPILGMLPSLLLNLSNIFNYINSTLQHNGGTFLFKGPWLSNMNILFTSDPINVQHITSTRFENYGKGDDFRDIFEVLGDGIFRSDSNTWKHNRTLLHSIFKQTNFQGFIHKTFERKVSGSLIVFLEHACQKGMQVDLQDAFQRLTFDNICLVVLGFDPNCLSIELPQVACERAFTQAEDTLFYRHIKPRCFWKLQKWLQLGDENKFKENIEIVDKMLYAEIRSKHNKMKDKGKSQQQEFDLLNVLMNNNNNNNNNNNIDDKYLRDTAINLLAAGRDTISAGLTWFFWLVATHPFVEAKIVEEIRENIASKGEGDGYNWKNLGLEGLGKLVYLHGALCEALRLYPPVPFEHKSALKSDVLPSGHKINSNIIEHKSALKSDVLPSGHKINSNIMIVYSLYSVGRVEKIWGNDCLEFKPERWISNRGGLIHVPSYKFIAFNAGPRSCLGKDISFIEMKMVAAAIFSNYHIHLLQGHPIIPSISVVLHMKHGFKVMLAKRTI